MRSSFQNKHWKCFVYAVFGSTNTVSCVLAWQSSANLYLYFFMCAETNSKDIAGQSTAFPACADSGVAVASGRLAQKQVFCDCCFLVHGFGRMCFVFRMVETIVTLWWLFFFSIQYVYTLLSVFLYKKATCSQLTQEQINCFWILRNSQWLCLSLSRAQWAGFTTICFIFTFVPSPRTVLRYNEHHHHHHDDQNECWKAWEDII